MKKGNVEILLPQKDVTICFTQVGRMEQGEFVLEFPFEKSGVNLNALRTAKQLEEAAQKLKPYVSEGFLIEAKEETEVMVENLNEGVYLINSMESTEGKTMLPTLLFLPTWDETEGKMLYEVTVAPKYGEVPPKTGDETEITEFVFFFLFALMLIGFGIKKMYKKEECF